jgi:hypothetical protein
MNRRNLMLALPLAALVTLTGFPAGEAKAAAVDRLVWRHDGGHFENTAGNDWTEVSPDGVFRFKEVRRTATAIHLYDASRDCRVILTASECYVNFGAGPYRVFYRGYWER